METLQRDPQLWQKAKARAKFQSHLGTYLWVNGLLWAIWALTSSRHHGLPWPVWTSFFWGIGLVMNGIAAYASPVVGLSRGQRTQREYERLVREQGSSADPLDKYR